MNYFILIFLILLSSCSPFISHNYSTPENQTFNNSAKTKNGMVVSENSYATLAGLQVLKEGGNAVDAAVTVGFTLAVTFPRAGNLGGGGFMLLYDAKSNEVKAIDYREKAPKASTTDMFLDENGEVDEQRSRNSILSVGVPGTVAGLVLALEKYGTISLARALQPAIQLAEQGITVDSGLKESLELSKDLMARSDESISNYFKDNGASYNVGDTLKQENLAWSLKQIKKRGKDAFYEGEIANKIVAYMEKEGGLISKADLKAYKPVIREPVKGYYWGYEIYSMPPPSSGGVHIIQMLNILERLKITKYKRNSSEYIHLLSETMKFAYADRSKHLGDPDFVDVPVKQLLSKNYALSIAERIDLNKVIPSEQIKPVDIKIQEGPNTTHFSVMDKFGNVVSNTYTLNFSYGSKLSVPETGILLNNEMDDFSAKQGVPNAYGLIGGKYNAIEPEKRMLSSMSPTIVFMEGKPILATGSQGGSRIINTVLQIILNTVDYKMSIDEATKSPRFHHQWLPDKLFVESGIDDETISALKTKGYVIDKNNVIGSAQTIIKVGDYFYGATDPRRSGGLAKGY